MPSKKKVQGGKKSQPGTKKRDELSMDDLKKVSGGLRKARSSKKTP
jgi:hypothetical protein